MWHSPVPTQTQAHEAKVHTAHTWSVYTYNTKLRQMLQNTNMTVQLLSKACPYILDDPPVPQASKKVPHPCTIKAIHIIFFSLGFRQNLPPDIKYSTVQATLVSAIMITYFIIKELSVRS